MADNYGIPAGGDPYPGKVKYLGDNKRKLNARELIQVMKEAGWPTGTISIAAMVALAESGGSPFIYNTYKKGHFGLFQISRSAWPEFFEGGSNQWADPVANAKKALEIKKKQGWGAWQGYTNASYKKYDLEVIKAQQDELRGRPFGGGLLGDIKENGLSATVGMAVDAIGDAAEGVTDNLGLDVLSDAWEAITTPALWMRLAYGSMGVVLVVGGLFLVVRNSSAAKSAMDKAGKVAGALPTGKAAAAVKGVAK